MTSAPETRPVRAVVYGVGEMDSIVLRTAKPCCPAAMLSPLQLGCCGETCRTRNRPLLPLVRHRTPAQRTPGLHSGDLARCERPLGGIFSALPRRGHRRDRCVFTNYAAPASGGIVPQLGHKRHETRCGRNQWPLFWLRRSITFGSSAATYLLRPHDWKSEHVCSGLLATVRCTDNQGLLCGTKPL